MSETNLNSKIEVFGETCPVPLVEARKAVRKAEDGDIIEITGDHGPSKEEIPMAVKELGHEVLEVEDVENGWKIRIKVSRGED